MKYRVIRPFIAFGKAPDTGELVELTPEQAEAVDGCIAPYEVKVDPVPKVTKKKSSASSRAVRARKKVTRKNSRKSAKK